MNNVKCLGRYFGEYLRGRSRGLSSGAVYRAIGLEREAYEMGDQIERDVRARFPEGNAFRRNKDCKK